MFCENTNDDDDDEDNNESDNTQSPNLWVYFTSISANGDQ